MPIAEEIYAEAKKLPDELAREVLDFVYFIENRYALTSAAGQTLSSSQRPMRTPGSAVGKLKVLEDDDAYLQDFQD